ncbi:MAG: hypothetical protein HY578_00710 [Nitrospinae bacterium]|nr:hypothetical protein [Nitrospinota bacterium]
MKKLILLTLLLPLFFSCTPPKIEGMLNPVNPHKKPVMAIVSDSILADFLENMLLQRQFVMVERKRLYSVLSEQQLAMSGIMRENKLIEVGKMLNIDAMIFVNERQEGNVLTGMIQIMSATVKIVDVDSGKVIGSYGYTIGDPPGLYLKEDEIVRRIADKIAGAYK